MLCRKQPRVATTGTARWVRQSSSRPPRWVIWPPSRPMGVDEASCLLTALGTWLLSWAVLCLKTLSLLPQKGHSEQQEALTPRGLARGSCASGRPRVPCGLCPR